MMDCYNNFQVTVQIKKNWYIQGDHRTGDVKFQAFSRFSIKFVVSILQAFMVQ